MPWDSFPSWLKLWMACQGSQILISSRSTLDGVHTASSNCTFVHWSTCIGQCHPQHPFALYLCHFQQSVIFEASADYQLSFLPQSIIPLIIRKLVHCWTWQKLATLKPSTAFSITFLLFGVFVDVVTANLSVQSVKESLSPLLSLLSSLHLPLLLIWWACLGWISL